MALRPNQRQSNLRAQMPRQKRVRFLGIWSKMRSRRKHAVNLGALALHQNIKTSRPAASKQGIIRADIEPFLAQLGDDIADMKYVAGLDDHIQLCLF